MTRSQGDMDRHLTLHEQALIARMLDGADGAALPSPELGACLVRAMDDGGMGSLRFASDRLDRTFGRIVAKATFLDDDGVDVRVALIVDDRGELFEVDVWKVDFSPLHRIPPIGDIKFAD